MIDLAKTASDPDDGGSGAPPPRSTGRSTATVIIAGVIALALVLGGAIAAVFAFSGGAHEIVTPASAGGMKRDTAQEKKLKSQLDSAEQQFKTQAKEVEYVRSAVYSQNDTERGPKAAMVFLGARLSKEQSPQKFVDNFGEKAKANGFTVTEPAPGDGGGKAVCAEQSAQNQKVAICAWATEDSIGELIPTVPGYGSTALADLMRDLRKDVEKS